MSQKWVDGNTSQQSCEPQGIRQKRAPHQKHSDDLLQLQNMQISLPVGNKRRNHSNDEHGNVSCNVDLLSIKLKHYLLK